VRRLLVLVGSIVFLDALLFGALSPLIPGYADQFDLSKAGAGLLAGSFGAGALVGGIPGGLAAHRFGPKRAVVLGLGLLAGSSFLFAVAGSAEALGLARFLQGVSSNVTWAGALAWLTVQAPRARRGELLGTVFGVAISGAILGPMFGGIAETIGIRGSFVTVGAVAVALAAWSAARPPGPAEEEPAPGALRRAFRDPRFLGGLWLNTLPALLFGTLMLLVPLALDRHDFSALAIGAVFLGSGAIEVALNPLLGRFSDRRGLLLPIRVALAASVGVAALLAVTSRPVLLVVLVCAAAIAWGGFYTPGMTLVSHRAETVGLSQGLAFGVMNSAWALGNLTGPALGGALANAWSDAVPYLAGASLCLLTLLAAQRVASARV
jgi:predicted MFS family arabinose efflux permease